MPAIHDPSDSPGTLLIVDDEPSIRKILEHFLKTDFNVVTHSNGLDALGWLEKGQPVDLIVADINMPQLNGEEFTRAIRASSLLRDIPIIILSSLDSSADRIKYLELGADDFIVKPFNPQEVKVRVKTVLRRTKGNYTSK